MTGFQRCYAGSYISLLLKKRSTDIMTKRKYLTQQEVALLLEQAKQTQFAARNHCLVYMGFVHGLRASELLGLRLSDMDLHGRTLYVRRLKNGFSTSHPLLAQEVKIIRAWLRERKQFRGAETTDWLFLSRTGGPLTRQQFYNIIRKLGGKTEISVCSHPHMLRHACGYALADRGVDTRLIQDYLGHRNIRHTVRYTASNAARFEDVWRMKVRRSGGRFGPKCPLALST